MLLPDSVKPVESGNIAGPPSPHRPTISRIALKPSESAAKMTIEVTLKMRNFAELRQRVADGEKISPREITAKYDPSAADYQSVLDWVSSQGLTIVRSAPDHLAVFASGKVSQIQQAFKVNFARVTLEGKEYTSAISAPRMPASLAPLLIGVNGLQPHIRPHKHLIKQGLDGSAATYYPSQLAQAYGTNGLYSANITGSGQTIAIVIDTFPSTDDLITFWKTANVHQSINNIQFVQAVAGTLPEASGEETLDTEWSSSIAPGAKVRVYAATDLAETDLDQTYEQVYEDVTNHPGYGIHQMSMSYGGGETYTTLSQCDTDDQYFTEITAAGVTIFASSGDSGSTPGQNGTGDETGPLQAEFPASDPNVAGVGGTTLILTSSNAVSSETVWNNASGAGGGGVSEYFNRPSWQTGTGVSGGMREVPDLTATADPNYGALIVLDSTNQDVGGTSWGTPTCAAFCALLNEARQNAGLSVLGTLGPQIYPYLLTSNFRDITTGNNATPKSGGLYSATIGYDEASGIGVPVVQTFAQTLVGSAALRGVQESPLSQTIIPGQNATITVTAGGSPVSYQWQRMPFGSTTWGNLSNNGTYSGTTTPSLTVTAVTSAMSGDQFQCVVTYSGNKTLTSTASVLIADTPLQVSLLAGQVGTTNEDNGTGTAAGFAYPSGITLDSSGNVYVADYNNNAIRKVTPAGVVTTPYGSLTGKAGDTNAGGNNALFNTPNGVVADNSNNLYVADTGNNQIRKITTATGGVNTFASGFNEPNGISIDKSGNLYVADTGNNVVKKIISNGTVSVLAGKSGTAGYANGTGTAALFNTPTGLAVDSSGNVYVADYGNYVLRKITPAGVVTTVAGQPEVSGYMDGTSTNALLNGPNGVAVDSLGNIYITDSLIPPIGSNAGGNELLRKLNTSGVLSTIAGDPGVTGSANGTGTAAQFYSLQAAAINSNGEYYMADTYNQTIRAGGIAPSLATGPLSETVTVNQPTSFSITAAGTAPYTYQWQVLPSGGSAWSNLSDGSAYTGSVEATLEVNSPLASMSGNQYRCVVTTSFGSATSTSATLTVNPLTIASQPTSQAVDAGYSITLSVTASGTSPFSYQWQVGDGNISGGATSSSYSITNFSNSNVGTYDVAVSDDYGNQVTSSPFTLTITSTYASWAGLYFTTSQMENSAISGESATPENDGVPNLLKYLFDINPTEVMKASDIAALPVVGITTISVTNYLTLTYRQYTLETGLTVNVQTSPDLVNWTTVNNPAIVQTGTDPNTGDPIMQAQVPFNGTVEFIRLNVTAP
ncbi:MAG TPA: protease pro-enzyme activation domain-containing protein [Candidatus Methylacidiphilales bacterium]|nr:protease pro-enzyme activation domain-containing protein [Candidatus Methylacidiphilales bacterium]